jgi:hypothetical protein
MLTNEQIYLIAQRHVKKCSEGVNCALVEDVCAAIKEALLLAAPTPAAAQDDPKCRACNGNDGDIPCAYPEGHPHCLRNIAAQNEREAFETWAHAHNFGIERMSPGSHDDYSSLSTEFAWWAWQARAAAQNWADGRLTIHPDFQDDYSLFESIWAMQMPTNEMKSLCFYYFRRGAEKARAAANKKHQPDDETTLALALKFGAEYELEDLWMLRAFAYAMGAPWHPGCNKVAGDAAKESDDASQPDYLGGCMGPSTDDDLGGCMG